MTEFWRKKMTHYFNIFDFNKDGVIDQSDFNSMATNFSELENADPVKREKFVRHFVNVWKKLKKSSDDKSDKSLTCPVLIESVRQQLYDPEIIIEYRGLIGGLFTIMDFSVDGYMDEGEFRRIFEHYGMIDLSWTKKAFVALDLDQDGKLSHDEFLNGFFDFLFSQYERSASNLFFGPYEYLDAM